MPLTADLCACDHSSNFTPSRKSSMFSLKSASFIPRTNSWMRQFIGLLVLSTLWDSSVYWCRAISGHLCHVLDIKSNIWNERGRIRSCHLQPSMTELISKQASRALKRGGQDRAGPLERKGLGRAGMFLMFSPSLAQDVETMNSYVCYPITESWLPTSCGLLEELTKLRRHLEKPWDTQPIFRAPG